MARSAKYCGERLNIWADYESWVCNHRVLTSGRFIAMKGPQILIHAMPDFYNSADVLILPSLCDSFPMAILEAMACGLVALAGNHAKGA